MNNSREAFVLLEALVALTMFSILSLSIMGLLQNLSGALRADPDTTHYEVIADLKENPDYFQGETRLERIEVEEFEDGSSWEMYQYRPENEKTFRFSIFRTSRD